MPTGYTSIIDDKPDCTFEEFALRCAGAFLVCMRDKGDYFIPDEIEPSTYHAEQVAKLSAELVEVEALSDEEAVARAKEIFARECRKLEESDAKDKETRKNYIAMREKVSNWTPPPDHEALKTFMLDQLRTGEPDAGSFLHSFIEKTVGSLYRIDEYAASWKQKRIVSLKRDLAYHMKEDADEAERSVKTTKWIQDLKQSLKED